MTASKVYGVILAGGKGTRMGNVEKPKQFMEIGGKPIIVHTIEKFVMNTDFCGILVLSPKQWIKHTEDLVRKYLPMDERVKVIEGGVTRNDTIMNAISYIEQQGDLDEDTIIVTHDSVRTWVHSQSSEPRLVSSLNLGVPHFPNDWQLPPNRHTSAPRSPILNTFLHTFPR